MLEYAPVSGNQLFIETSSMRMFLKMSRLFL